MTETPVPGHGLHERFLRGLSVSPRRTAIRVDAESLTYEEAHELALRRAGALRTAAAPGPNAVAVLADKSLTAYVGILAALYSGATVVPLNPRFPAERTRRMLTAAGVSTVIADPVGRAALAETELDLPVLDEAAAATARPLDAPAAVRPSDIAYVLFTSGSTGQPKGVPMTHAANDFYFSLLDDRYDFGPTDVFCQNVGLNFDCAMFEMFCGWGHGAAVHAVPPAAHRDLPAFFAERRMTVWFSTPSGIAFIRRMGGLTPGSMPTLRWSFFAGEALLCEDAADWQAAAPRSLIENLYGPTELTITISGHRWSGETSPSQAVNGVVPIGPVHPGHEHLLLDGDEESDVEGELCVSGPQMTPGYLDPEDDRGRFVERAGRRWYRTGDRVRRLADGTLVYLGRLDAQVQIQGVRVELSEIDHAVRQCAGVQNAATVTRPAPGGGLELVLYYTGKRVPAATLRRELSALLPEAMVPKAFRHVTEFPLNSNRKVDRKRLAREAAGMSEGHP
ncbi:AMP-binding protein [Streptomyces radicis]|uniref:D-alanine--poly(Phosphoribitol) ligase n=1 Tax=Streptomyces radicis TaxID=1750517 RepID=A0A3A9WDG1_9ACTN|nr:AMP-binding protein [Streptomyces radicis]RKN07424.1 D-alanine--poly(phosphoribitol) ligase [Streptomyces radicis]RKN19557.1 D-alanine--poly(phosphoribitol) ligase [Streptomyces radicis]